MANRTHFEVPRRLELLAQWQESGLSAADFAGTVQHLSPQMLYNWRFHLGGTKQPLGRPSADGYVVVEPVALDADTHRILAARAHEASQAAGRVVSPSEYAESIVRNYLIVASTCDRLSGHGITTGSGRGAKGRGRHEGGGDGGQDAAAAARRAGSKVRAGARGRKGTGTTASGAGRGATECRAGEPASAHASHCAAPARRR